MTSDLSPSHLSDATRDVGPVPAAGPVAPFVTDTAPKGYKRPDMLILDDIARELADDPRLEARDVEVTCAEGVVTVTGSVQHQEDKVRIEGLVATTFGVRGADMSALELRRELEPPDPEALLAQSEGTSHATLAAKPPAMAKDKPAKSRRG